MVGDRPEAGVSLMVKKVGLFALLFLAAAPCCESYNSAQRRRELNDEYGTSSPTWEMLSPADKTGTVICGLLVLFIVVAKLRSSGER